MNSPTRLTLVTDMSARGDSALARAAQPCGARNVELRVVHAGRCFRGARLTPLDVCQPSAPAPGGVRSA